MSKLNSPEFIYCEANEFFDNGIKLAESKFTETKAVNRGFDGAIHAFLSVPITNIILGLELGLKGLITLSNGKNVTGHDLTKLFTLLDEKIQNKILDHYQSHNRYKHLVSIRMIEEDGLSHGKISFMSKINKDLDGITNLLESHKIFFVDFRYMYEFDSKKKIVRLSEFSNLTFSTLEILKGLVDAKTISLYLQRKTEEFLADAHWHGTFATAKNAIKI